MTIICINSTRTFQTQNGPHSQYREPNEAYNDFIEEYEEKKNRLYKKYVKSPPTSSETRDKASENKLTHLIRIATRKYTTLNLRVPEMTTTQLGHC